MKKTNNTKPSSKPKPPTTGFGFGEAMFNMKALTSDYAQFNEPPKLPGKDPPPPAQKKPIPVPNSKPVVSNPPKTVILQ